MIQLTKAKEVLNDLLVDVFNHIVSIEGLSLKKKGVQLSMTEVHILEAIENANDPSMSVIAKKLIVTVGTLTTAIDKLVLKGYVERFSAPNDRRKVLLKLTDKSFPVLKVHKEFHEEMIDNVILDMGLEDDSELINSLENLSIYFRNKQNGKN